MESRVVVVFLGKKIQESRVRDNGEEQAADWPEGGGGGSSQTDITVSSEDLARKCKCVDMQCVSYRHKALHFSAKMSCV
jgi:hypothetical protein